MNYLFRKLVEIRAYFILYVLCNLLIRYTDKDRMNYKPKKKFKHGDKVKLNWKFIVQFFDYAYNNIKNWYVPDVWTVDKIDLDNVVYTIEGEIISQYWLCAA